MARAQFTSGRMDDGGAESVSDETRPASEFRRPFTARLKKEVKVKLDDLKRQAKLNRKAIVAKDSLAAYLQRWLDNDVAIDRSDNTIAEYEMATRLYVTPYIGAVKLRKLDGEHLLAWQSALKKDGHSDNTRLRSIRTLRNALSRLGFFQSVLATLSEMAWVA